MEDYLPPGFRFYPTEEELVSFYLHNKLEGRNDRLNRIMDRVIPVLDIYEFNPWDLPQFSGNLCYGDPEQWFFFVPKQESEARGGRPKRLTTLGYWKATGCPGHVYSSDDRKIGHKRTMVFYNGRAPNGRKTDWKMNEYKLAMESEGGASSSNGAPPTPAAGEEFSLCRVYKKSKCVRAYDRRPIGVGISGTRDQQMRGDETRSTTHESPDPTVERTVLTPDTENSSTGDHQDQNLPQTGGSTTGTAMTQDTDPLWEWEQLLTDFDFDNEDMKPN